MAEREECTGIAAQWCPNCGTCNCPLDHNGERTRDRATCPLHGVESRHAETLCAGGCGEMVTDDGERCDACEAKHLRAELDALRAIIEGRTTPPSDEEIAAHAAAGGSWLCRIEAPDLEPLDSSAWLAQSSGRMAQQAARWRRTQHKVFYRWWALDAQRRPCAWPVVTEVSRG